MKTHSIERTRLVPHTVDGRTEMVLDRYTVDVPVPPRDWDRIVLTAATAGTVVLVTAAVAWSTASIGELLARVTIAPAAYGAALTFDAAWIVCMAVEWLARYDPRRAELPRRAGWFALAVAMAAVGAHGWIAGQFAIGAIGAAVSGIAKTAWTIVMAQHSRPLDDRTQQWVDKQRAQAGGELAMVAVRRQLQRARGAVTAEQAALTGAAPVAEAEADASPDADPDPADTADPDPDSIRILRPTVRDAVQTAYASGIDNEERVLGYVRRVADPDARPETVARYLRAVRRTA